MGFFFNDYPDRMPFLERVGKELRFRKAVQASRRAHGEPQFIVAHPDWPSKRASIMAYADTLKWAVTNRKDTPSRFNNGSVRIQLAFDDRTEKGQAQTGFWNGHCVDISKGTLDRHHQEVFGYGLAVDPTYVEYSASANTDDGSCVTLVVEGCTDAADANNILLPTRPIAVALRIGAAALNLTTTHTAWCGSVTSARLRRT